jgi:YD repeat-containing protein
LFDSVGRIHRGNYPWSVLLCGYLRRELHDDLDQLLRENIEAQNKTYVYTYDNAGNRTSKKTYAYTTANSLSSLTYTEETYTYGSEAWGDQLTTVGSTTVAYDKIGNPTTYNGYDLTWHGRQLKKMKFGSQEIKFLYNAEGIRTVKEVNNVEHVYTLNDTQIVSEAWNDNLLIYLYDEKGFVLYLRRWV